MKPKKKHTNNTWGQAINCVEAPKIQTIWARDSLCLARVIFWSLFQIKISENTCQDPGGICNQLSNTHGSERDHAERKYCKWKLDIHPEYRSVVFMDATTGYKFSAVQLNTLAKQLKFEGETYPLIRVEIIRLTPILHWTSKFTRQMDVWIVSTKIRSPNKN